MSNNMDVAIIVKAVDNASAIFKKIGANFDIIGKSAGNVGKKFENVSKEAGALGVKLLAVAAGAGYVFKTQFLDVASQFEKFQTILETTEGSSAKAEKAMKWVSAFAAKTPYELAETTDAFVKLRAYGLNPTNGLLKTLGDTSSAMGKPLMQAVEAIADAVTGENERLKEFGIKAQIVGNKIVYQYTQNGKTMTKSADKNNRQMIESTLTGIFNKKYSSAMDRLSRTWDGVMSNISDQWTRFTNLTMQKGVFDYLKNKLQLLLDKLNEMANNGKLEKIATLLGKNLVYGFEQLWKIGKELVPVIYQFGVAIDSTAKIMGGYKNLALVLAGLMAGKFIFSVLGLVKSFWDLGVTVFTVAAKVRNLAIVQKAYNGIMAISNAITYRGGIWKALQYSLMVTKFRTIELIGTVRVWIATQWASLRAGVAFSAGLVKMAAGNIWNALSGGIIRATTAMWGLTVSLFANPITWWVVGIGAAIAITVALVKNWDKVVKIFNNATNAVKKFFASFGKGDIKVGVSGIPAAQSKGPIKKYDVGSKGILNTGLAIVHKDEKIIPAGQKIGGGSTIHFAPQITVMGGGNIQEIQAAVERSFANCMKDFQRQQARLAY